MWELLVPVLVPLLGAGLVFVARGRTARFSVLLAATLAHMGATGLLWRSFPNVWQRPSGRRISLGHRMR